MTGQHRRQRPDWQIIAIWVTVALVVVAFWVLIIAGVFR